MVSSGKRTILIYENRKSEPTLWEISTPQAEEHAIRELFDILATGWNVYGELEDPVERAICDHKCEVHRPAVIREQTNRDQVEFYKRAKTGDVQAMAILLELRRNYEYEEWNITTLEPPS